MAQPSNKPDLFRWKRYTNSGASLSKKVHLSDVDIKSWIKRVEAASEFAVSEAFSPKKSLPSKPSRAVALESVDQLQDHDEAFTEAQALLNDWMNQKLRLELEMEEEGDSPDSRGSAPKPFDQPANSDYKNFDGEDSIEVHGFLQNLMEADVFDSGSVRDLQLEAGGEKKRGSDPGVTMEMRHKLVKERRERREAELERKRRQQAVQKEAREEAQRLAREGERRRKEEAQRQEELLQQEVKRLRREMEEKRSVQQLERNRERERVEKERTIQKTPRPDFVKERKQIHSEQEAETQIHIHNLQCMQKHFSAWYSVVLEKRVRLGKAAALCDWRRQLRAWRGWKALVWLRRAEKEAERTEEELRLDNRRCQLAEESDRRRLLRRCMSEWRLWSRMEKERRELLNQQEETRRKMAALIDAAASGQLAAQGCTEPTVAAPPDGASQSANAKQPRPRQGTSGTTTRTLTDRTTPMPTQAWQVTRRHATVSQTEVHERRQAGDLSTEVRGGRFEHRHAAQQKTIAEQRRLLREQQDMISQLQERQNLLELEQEAKNVGLKHSASRGTPGDGQTRSKRTSGEHCANHPVPKEHVNEPHHPAVRAMEDRARQRAERRREVEEMKRRREEEKLAQMKAEEEERIRQEEEEKRTAAEKRREEKRQKRERELEKQKRIEHESKLLKQAGDHYQRFLLLHRGIAPWRQLVQLSHANRQKAVEHHKHVLQRRCLLSWLQTADEALATKNASADQLYEHILLRRALFSWKRLKQLQSDLEAQAEHFYVTQTQRKVFTALLGYTTDQRLATWDKEQKADQHSARRALCRCFGAWRRLPAVLKQEREREGRRDELRRKVAEILPDFRTSPLDGMWSPRLQDAFKS